MPSVSGSRLQTGVAACRTVLEMHGRNGALLSSLGCCIHLRSLAFGRCAWGKDAVLKRGTCAGKQLISIWSEWEPTNLLLEDDEKLYRTTFHNCESLHALCCIVHWRNKHRFAQLAIEAKRRRFMAMLNVPQARMTERPFLSSLQTMLSRIPRVRPHSYSFLDSL